MSDEVSLEDIEREQKAMGILTAELEKAEDFETMELILAELNKVGQRLESMGVRLDDQVTTEHAVALENEAAEKALPPKIEVVLTQYQRQKVFDETGVDMPSVIFDDPDGKFAQTMPVFLPPFIQEIAIEKAKEFKAMISAQEAAQAEIAKIFAELEANATPELLAELERMKADPEFLAGMAANLPAKE